MSIAEVMNATGSTGAPVGGVNKKDQLGQAEFLELMIAQLKNQDPFKAMDPSQFLGQLAQFGTVSGIQEMQQAFGSFAEAMRSSQVLDGATMVGRDVLVAADEATLGETGGVRGAIDVPAGVSDVQVNVLDASGQLVRRITLPNAPGLTDFTWDGAMDNGTRAPAGAYTFEAVASAGGQTGSLEMMLSSRVSSVTIDGARGLQLNTATLGVHSLSDVRRVM